MELAVVSHQLFHYLNEAIKFPQFLIYILRLGNSSTSSSSSLSFASARDDKMSFDNHMVSLTVASHQPENRVNLQSTCDTDTSQKPSYSNTQFIK